MAGHLHTNRLIHETSPYLLQHAHNPVDWYPWGEEAFEKARRENRPILLSIGYSTCHWCHVMERESFEDEEIAAFLNEHYVPIKVDREQRPDLDAVYMSAVQWLTGQGGWPMTVWLTPDRRPFYGGTYFPPRDGDRGSRIGFLTLLERLHEVFKNDPQKVEGAASSLVHDLEAHSRQAPADTMPTETVLRETYEALRAQYDPEFGGFGHSPKFPRPVTLSFLFAYGAWNALPDATEMALETLRKMARGGIHDQIGGGFHRYSVDRHWLVPHFEKMLYDNAQLALAYLTAYRITGEKEFERVVRRTLDYVLREMTDAEGGFLSATDADSEGEEGTFFVWSKSELISLLGVTEGERIAQLFGVTPAGNFEGKNILHLPAPLDEATDRSLASARQTLYEARGKRVLPLTDDKILTSWNGLMIAALAGAGFALREPTYIRAAERAANFVLSRMKENGTLLRSYREGRAAGRAFLDDYQFLTFGFLSLFEASGDGRWLQEAIWCTDETIRLFGDAAQGGFFITSLDHEKLMTREKSYYDGAEPSGNAVACLNLLRLERLTDEAKYGEWARKTFQALGQALDRQPGASPLLALALGAYLHGGTDVVIVRPETENAENFHNEWRRTYLPEALLVSVRDGAERKSLEETVPLLRDRPPQGGCVTAYVCRNRRCELPATDADSFRKQLLEGRS